MIGLYLHRPRAGTPHKLLRRAFSAVWPLENDIIAKRKPGLSLCGFEGGLTALRHMGSNMYPIYFSLCLSVARIDTPPLQPAAFAFVSYGYVLVRAQVRVRSTPNHPDIAKLDVGALKRGNFPGRSLPCSQRARARGERARWLQSPARPRGWREEIRARLLHG